MATSPPPPTLTASTSLALDALRGLSAQAVVVGHCLAYFDVYPREHGPLGTVPIQDVAVVVFFVLSGLLITHSTLRKRDAGGYALRDYLLERAARIYSGLIPAMIAIAAIDGVHFRLAPAHFEYPENLTPWNWLATLGMVQELPGFGHLGPLRFLAVGRFGTFRPVWSLQVEWWIYLLFGWAVLARRRSRIVYGAGLGALLLIPGYYAFGRHTIAAVWPLGLGLALLVRRSSWSVPRPSVLLGGASVALVGMGLHARHMRTAYDGPFALLLTAVLAGLVLALQQVEREPSAAVARVIRFVAEFSFTLYLVHYPVMCLVGALAAGRTIAVALTFVMSNVLAAALAPLGEKRHRRLARWLRRRLAPAR